MPITNYYVASDAMGSTTAILDEEGNVLERRSYDAFGEMNCMAPDGTTVATSPTEVDVGFQGQARDDVTKLYQMGFRWYIPTLGRWTTPDPAGLNGGPDSYAGFKNSPNIHTDYFGLEPSVAGDYLSMYRNFKSRAEQQIASCKKERAENIATLKRLAASNSRPSDNCQSQTGCHLISVVVEIADPCASFPDSLIGHAGVGIDNSYYDFGPKHQSFTSTGTQWWANPEHPDWDGFYRKKDSSEVTLKDVVGKIGQLADRPAVIIQYCACSKATAAVQSHWDNLYYEIREGTCNWNLLKRSCTSEALQSTTGERKIGVTSFALIEALINGIRSSCGDTKGSPPNVRVISTTFQNSAAR